MSVAHHAGYRNVDGSVTANLKKKKLWKSSAAAECLSLWVPAFTAGSVHRKQVSRVPLAVVLGQM